jgi:putative endonuclease
VVLLFGWFYRWCDDVRHRRRMRSGNAAHALGRRGEDLAHRLLQREGCYVLARNYRTPSATAEVDIVARDGDTLVFVEVKTRSSAEYGSPESAVDTEKRRKIVRGAEHYLRRTDARNCPVRFDIVSVLFESSGAKLHHLRDAFRPEGLVTPPI